jgi:predicted short-subunit dehydrogenase-like oxidoreductase (DUF2520 family)
MSDLGAVAVVGLGHVGRALADALVAVGVVVERIEARKLPKSVSSPTYLLCVRDRYLPEVARALVKAHEGAPPVLLHTAGALPSSVLRVVGAPAAAVVHPLVAFAGDAPRLAGALFAVEGDARGRAAAEALVGKLGGRVLALDAIALARYHAAAALAANHALALVAIAEDLMAGLGADRALAARGLTELFVSVARNLERLGLPDALTGPIARGDASAVERHLDALNDAPEARTTYLATARRLVRIARAQGRADIDGLRDIEAQLDAVDASTERLPLYAPGDLD